MPNFSALQQGKDSALLLECHEKQLGTYFQYRSGSTSTKRPCIRLGFFLEKISEAVPVHLQDGVKPLNTRRCLKPHCICKGVGVVRLRRQSNPCCRRLQGFACHPVTTTLDVYTILRPFYVHGLGPPNYFLCRSLAESYLICRGLSLRLEKPKT